MKFSIDVNDANFYQEVLEKSESCLVVVDFWADWCSPCRVLKPILEKLAQEYKGKFVLAKVDTQLSPVLAQSCGVQSIPDVRFFKDGEMVDGFVGVIQEGEIRKLLDKYVAGGGSPGSADLSHLFYEKKWDALAVKLEKEMESHEVTGEVLVMAARLFFVQGQMDQGLAFLNQIGGEDDAFDLALQMKPLARFDEAVETLGSQPIDGYFRQANAAFHRGEFNETMEALLEVLFRDKDYKDELARELCIALYSFIQDKEMLRSFQRQMAMAIHV